jgi:hypothetical protein
MTNFALTHSMDKTNAFICHTSVIQRRKTANKTKKNEQIKRVGKFPSLQMLILRNIS